MTQQRCLNMEGLRLFEELGCQASLGQTLSYGPRSLFKQLEGLKACVQPHDGSVWTLIKVFVHRSLRRMAGETAPPSRSRYSLMTKHMPAGKLLALLRQCLLAPLMPCTNCNDVSLRVCSQHAMAALQGRAPRWVARPSAVVRRPGLSQTLTTAAPARVPPPAAAGASTSALVPVPPPAGKAQMQRKTAGLLEDPPEVRSAKFGYGSTAQLAT